MSTHMSFSAHILLIGFLLTCALGSVTVNSNDAQELTNISPVNQNHNSSVFFVTKNHEELIALWNYGAGAVIRWLNVTGHPIIYLVAAKSDLSS